MSVKGKSLEMASGFSSLTDDELFFINGGSGSSPSKPYGGPSITSSNTTGYTQNSDGTSSYTSTTTYTPDGSNWSGVTSTTYNADGTRDSFVGVRYTPGSSGGGGGGGK